MSHFPTHPTSPNQALQRTLRAWHIRCFRTGCATPKASLSLRSFGKNPVDSVKQYSYHLASIVLVGLVGCAGLTNKATKSVDQTRALLIGGTWARHLDDKLFFADGSYESHDRFHDAPDFGHWYLEEDTLTMTEAGETTVHRIDSISQNDLDMTFGDGSEGLHYHRFKRDEDNSR